MRCQSSLNVGSILREAREQQGLSQRRLALRAGTSQDAISRIERGDEALGRRPVLSVEPLEGPVPQSELAASGAMSPSERLSEASSWNRMATQLAAAGEQARSEDHPATVRRER
jgi:transcriptional regulator with XRE-family HTH domain